MPTRKRPAHSARRPKPAPELPPPPKLPDEPLTPDELHAWLDRELHLHIPRTSVVEGHSAPFDYLCFAFFGPGPDREARPDCVLWANRGGGKTFLGAVATLLDLLYRPGIQIRILAGSLEQAKRMHAHLTAFFDPINHPAFAALLDGPITERRITLTTRSTVELLAQSQTSVRGTRVQKLRCDEVDLFDPDVWDAAQLTTRSARCGTHDVVGSVECLSTMHLPYGVMHRLVGECHDGRRRLFRWGLVDSLERCPPEHFCGPGTAHPPPPEAPQIPCPLLPECNGCAKDRLPPGGHITIDDAVSQKRRVAQAIWDTEMLCLRPRRTDCVLPEFDRARHLFDHDGPAPSEISQWAIGMDFGIRAPTAILYCAVSHAGQVWVMDERIIADVVLDEHIRAIEAGLARDGVAGWPRPTLIAADPAGHQLNYQTGVSVIKVMESHGLLVKTPYLGITEGLGLLRARLAPASGDAARLFIHTRCTRLIECMERYRYPTNPEITTPEKGEFDHAIDALRYLVVTLDRPTSCTHSNYTAPRPRGTAVRRTR